ncbi:serine protease snake-like [Drosophila eugracilis]|uniref:serine protease snake-like n=1 Tax=Drosophila eugracilis TaxID=29029 RepID=UPI0007E63DCA|nr:serine protease snake-like [Drosophila eugracilis]
MQLHSGKIYKQMDLSVIFISYLSFVQISVIPGKATGSTVVGGNPAPPKKYPMAARLGHVNPLENDTKWFCGGTLISHRVVLTAAHCFYSDVGSVNIVRLGELVFDSNTDDAEPEDYEVLESKAHPDFRYPVLYNDIGIVRLRKHVTFSVYKMPACLPLNNGEQLSFFTAIGWGQTEYDNFEPSKELMEVRLRNYNRSCRETTYPNEDLPEGYKAQSQLCIGYPGHRDTCNGDSGGPLLIAHTGNGCKFQVMGITSVGIACDTPNVPSLYTRVHSFQDWIIKEINSG